MKTKLEIPVFTIAFLAMFLLKTVHLNAQHAILGTTDINAYLEEAPGLPATTEEAMKRDGAHPLQPDHEAADRFYKPFEDKVNRRIRDYQDFAQQKMSKASTNSADYEKETIAMANSNPIIAGMGGYEKISQMSEAERKVAAQKAAAAYTANPPAANGMRSPGMTAMQQKIMSDPAYRKQFEKMSDAEKEAELRKYMANDTPAAMTPEQAKAQQEKNASEQVKANRVRNAMEVKMKTAELQQKIGEASLAFNQKLGDIVQQGRSHQVIGEEIGVRYNAIPIVELGEYGHDHDPELVRLLRIEEAKLHRERAALELKQNTLALAEAADRYQAIVSECLEFVKKSIPNIYDGVSPKDVLEATNTEQPLLAFETGLLSLALELSEKSRELTSNAARWEANYVQVMQSCQAGK